MGIQARTLDSARHTFHPSPFSSSGITMATSAGTIRFRAKDKGSGKLQITIVSCSDLRDADAAGIGFGNNSDPYVRVWVGVGNEKDFKKTKAISGKLDPKFPKETSQFTFDVEGGDVTAKKVFFEVMDKDTFTSDDKIGEAQIKLSAGQTNGVLIALALQDGKDDVDSDKEEE